ncbi:hypothetical protein BDZ94DRAFT_1230086 [Collybia nuda]|uniref:Uncharacterized protein n=1 Tax=Collybia nuda TaxID=64659 RepID=A0A9P5XSY5_9AGAR|nr:hypothetical protein BDZ94DRAFT_1230086 [Collybia nuda]
MRSSLVHLVQIIPRRTLQLVQKKIHLPPTPQSHDLKKPTLIEALMQQQASVGTSWPSNIRIEPVVNREAFKNVQSDVRTRMKKLLKER